MDIIFLIIIGYVRAEDKKKESARASALTLSWQGGKKSSCGHKKRNYFHISC
jgi:hypothetical protein